MKLADYVVIWTKDVPAWRSVRKQGEPTGR
jgi:hypothetical protein